MVFCCGATIPIYKEMWPWEMHIISTAKQINQSKFINKDTNQSLRFPHMSQFYFDITTIKYLNTDGDKHPIVHNNFLVKDTEHNTEQLWHKLKVQLSCFIGHMKSFNLQNLLEPNQIKSVWGCISHVGVFDAEQLSSILSFI